MRDTFASRVQALRESWVERRQISRLAGAHDFDSQLQLLLTLHIWATEAAQDIVRIYADAVVVTMAPRPEAADDPPAFSLVVADLYTVTFALGERRRMGGSRWHVSVSVRSPGSASLAYAGPERRNGQWTRGRLEDILLSILGAYERSASNEDGPGTGAGPQRVVRMDGRPGGDSLAG